MKEYKFWTLDLTTKNNLEGGFKKKHSEVTKEDLERALKNVVESVRRKAKVKKRNWKFCIFAVISNVHLTEQRKGAWHIHLVLYGSPASRLCREMKSYWTRHGYGNSIQQEMKACWDWKKLRYDIKQWLKEIECVAKFYQHGMEVQELRDSLIKQYPKETEWEKVFSDLMIDGDRITKWGFVGFAMSTKEGWTPREQCVTE